MVPGFNTDFKYRGETYHVQTEDNGVGNPVVVTLLYHKGAILASRRTSYRDLVDKPVFQQELMGLMKSQHKELMRALLAGEFDNDDTAPAVAGASGVDPAEAAAAVAGSPAAPSPAPTPVPPPVSIPSLRSSSTPVPSQAHMGRTAPASPLKTPMDRTPSAALRETTPAAAQAAQTTTPRPEALTLDEAIWHYLEEFAARSAAAVH